ncbi:uncharacterized protein LOC119912525 isoform X5 [Xyrichtys novacula]|uniref:Uncharacterized protein LOC119912525 isoform X5 n=1 Tax=Xyrichtys novacula TaxID=13765 RepID=A0AAV1EI81_XYRNO|nr:uncharacterized protein LOC119912525 isoform X5 [Xyrichtys novacula]
MFHTKDGLKLTPCALLVHIMLLILPPHCCCQGTPQVIGSPQPIVAKVGDDIILPCHLKPAVDASSQTVEWTRQDLNPRFVHVRRSGEELLDDQHPSFVGRTSLFPEELKYGNVSLHLSNVKLSDRGTYRCYIPIMNRDSNVELLVGAASSPVIVIKNISDGQVVLQCESKGWYPEPEVLWMDSDGNLLPAGPTETLRGPDGLYTVSSRVTVERKHKSTFTCRVQQTSITQTRDTGVQIEDDICASSSHYVAPIVILSLVCLVLFGAVFYLWKLGQKKTDKIKKGEREPLNEESENMKDKAEKKLQEKEEERDNILHVISILNHQRNELKSLKGKLVSEVKEVEEERRENEKKLDKVRKGPFVWDKDAKENSFLKTKMDLEKKRTEQIESLQNTEIRLQKINNMISKMTERKEKVENQIKKLSNGKNEQEQEDHQEEEHQEEKSEEEDEPHEPMLRTQTEMNSSSTGI